MRQLPEASGLQFEESYEREVMYSDEGRSRQLPLVLSNIVPTELTFLRIHFLSLFAIWFVQS